MVMHNQIDHTGLTGISSGAVATDAIWDAAGDLVQGTGANTAARLASGLDGKVLTAAGVGTAVAWEYPPGYEWDYVQKTTNTSITATTEGAADVVLTGASVTFDGAPVLVQWFSPNVETPASAGAQVLVMLYLDGAIAGYFTAPVGVAASEKYGEQGGFVRTTPTAAAHTYSVRAIVSTGTAVIGGGAAGTGAFFPTFMRITKV